MLTKSHVSNNLKSYTQLQRSNFTIYENETKIQNMQIANFIPTLNDTVILTISCNN